MSEPAYKTIPLTRGKCCLVDAEDYPTLVIHKWRYTCDSGGTGYALRSVTVAPKKQANLFMHRAILKVPRGLEIDHRNGNGLDNRKSNLRICTRYENARNIPKRPGRSSRYKGVTRHQDRWRVRIQGKGSKEILVGSFDNEVAAARAYDLAAIIRFGEFAKLNFPEGFRTEGERQHA